MRAIDEEGFIGTVDDQGSLPAVKLIPENAAVYMGENKTISVFVRADLQATSVSAEVDPVGAVELMDDPDIPLRRHERRRELLAGQIRLCPLVEDAETLLSVQVGDDHSAVGLIEVHGERIIEEVPVAPPTGLEFEPDSYRVGWGKRKTLRLVAPAEVVATAGSLVASLQMVAWCSLAADHD